MLCLDYGKELTKGSLNVHRQTQHGVEKGGPGQEGEKKGEGDKPRTFRMVFSAKSGPRPFPVEGCIGRAATRTAMRVHFWNRNVRDIMVILE